jgi:outer membrane immunogenic protein
MCGVAWQAADIGDFQLANNKLFLGAASFAVAALALSTAIAADLPTRKDAPIYAPPLSPAYNWTGFYLGANLGVSWSNGSSSLVGSPNFINNIVTPLGIPTSGYGNNTAGFFGGLQAGYNWQLNQAFVLGAETDMEWMSVNPHGTFVSPGPLPGGGAGAVVTNASARLNWLGTTRLRAGILATDRFMLYVTGGLAYGGGSYNASVTGVGLGGAAASWVGSNNASRLGWTIGGGGEYAITNNVTLRGEYLYYNLGNASNTTVANGAAAALFPNTYAVTRTQVEGSLLRAGINYKF